MEFQVVLDAINALGSMGVLVVFVYMFTRGDIISRKTLDEIINRLMAEFSARTIFAIDDIVEKRINDLKADIRAGRNQKNGGGF